VPHPLDDIRFELAQTNRVLAHEDVLDAFGHVSVRHPTDPSRYLLSRSRGPELVEPDDILEFTLDSEPVKPPTARLYSERVIHGEIYKARPDVHAVCHHHAPAIMPYVIAGVDIRPVYHMGATMGEHAPFWDSRDDFGDTNLLVVRPEEGASLARALGEHSAVLMRRHGATVVGTDLRALAYRCIYMCRNAEFQLRAMALGAPGPLTPGETRMAGALNLQPNVIGRAWEYWTARLDKSGGTPRRSAKFAKSASVSRKVTAKAKARKGGRTSRRTGRK
jgi:HCOMODA/2-hydroxy-3-carboxy-muconic semialdehyde decarboxylase